MHFISRALLFGQSGAVYGFNRLSKFVTCLATQAASLVVSGFYDDYTQLEMAKLAASSRATLFDIFELVGFKVATEPKKNNPF